MNDELNRFLSREQNKNSQYMNSIGESIEIMNWLEPTGSGGGLFRLTLIRVINLNNSNL